MCSSAIQKKYFKIMQCPELFLNAVSHSGNTPTMCSMISKWEHLQNRRAFKYLCSSLYVCRMRKYVSLMWHSFHLRLTLILHQDVSIMRSLVFLQFPKINVTVLDLSSKRAFLFLLNSEKYRTTSTLYLSNTVP